MYVDSQKAIAKTRMILHESSERSGFLAHLQARSGIFLLLLLVVLCLVVTAPSAMGQDDSAYLQDVSPPPVDGAVPVEMGYLDLRTGALNLQIPLGKYPQRGGGTGKYTLKYTSNNQFYIGEYSATNLFWLGGGWNWGLRTPWDASNDDHWPFGGWNMEPWWDCSYQDAYGMWVEIPCYYKYTNFSFTAPDGSTHTWGADIAYYDPYDTDHCPAAYGEGSGYDLEGTGYYLSLATGTPELYGPDGTSYSNLRTDPNGNFYPLSSDTLNRSLPTLQLCSNVQYCNSVQYLSLPNAEGGTSTYTIKLQNINFSTNFNYTTNQGIHVSETSGAWAEITEIDLPDGTAYYFTYDSGTTPGHYGQLTSITLPTGGTINYSYSNAPDAFGFMNRWLTHQTTPDSSTGWSYSTPGGIQHVGTKAIEAFTVTAPSGDYSIHRFGRVLGDMSPAKTEYYDASSNLLGTTTACYNQLASNYDADPSCPAATPNGPEGSYTLPVYKTADITTLTMPGGSSVTSMKTYTHDNYGNITKLQEWNFGSPLSGSPDRTTDTTYYNNGHVLNKPATITVTNSSGGLVAKTVNSYDGSALATSGATGIVNHDGTNYGSNFTGRGNLTQIQRYTSSSAYITQSMTYDITGQLRSLTDGKGNVTLYDYTDNFFNDAGDNTSPSTFSPTQSTNAYLTTAVQAYGTPVALTSTFGYYFGTGQMAKATDPNSQTTYSHFYDSLSRPTCSRLPDSGWTYVVYPNGSERQVDTYTGITTSSLTTNCPTTGNDCRQDQTLADTLGRTTSQILVSDREGAVTVATTYDSNGRVQAKSNPFRSTSDPTYGGDTYIYDGLGRRTQISNPDGSQSHIYYGAAVATLGTTTQSCSGVGYPVLTVDEAGKKRQVWGDALGRIIEVNEPDSNDSLTLSTCYTYDLNNNLTGVTQGSQTRSFTYDLLSRLTSATNPESGTISYTYDANGNVISKTAPKPNSAPGSNLTVTTNYAYDELNRLISKSYTDSTPAVTFAYDSTVVAYSKGRLTSVTSGTYTSSIDEYDAMGRVKRSSQTMDGQPYSFSYSYDLAGNLLTETYPSGRTVATNYDSAGRISSLTGTSRTYASTISYAPHGPISSMLLGTNKWEHSQFNNRLQPTQMGVGTSNTDSSIWGLSYDYLGASNCDYPQTANNGNIGHETTTIGSWNAVQLFCYDPLNRLQKATETIAGNTSLSQTYGYDRYGNRAVVAGSILSQALTPQSIAVYDSQNRIASSGYAYDAAGNLIVEAANRSMTYDAENRMLTFNGGSGTTYYTYDGNGKRVKKLDNGGYTYSYIYDALGRLAAEYSNATTTSPGVTYITTDHLGSTRLVTDSSGNVSARHDYLPFGEEIPAGSYGRTNDLGYKADTINQKFTAKERDSESGLDYFIARYFSAAQGRFTSPDAPLADQHAEDPQSWNMYGYVRNNPVRNTDPDGKDCFHGLSSCADYILGAVGAVGNAVTTNIVNLPNQVINAAISPFTSFQLGNAVPDAYTPANQDQRDGMNAANAIMIAVPVGEAAAGKIAEALGTTATAETTAAAVPTSIPAGPSARPTAAQQAAINEMGEAHGCSTCGTTTPGTKTGNWVGDHQPPTALNPPGGSQVYQPQCIQCSRQQGGQVAAAAKAAKRVCTKDANGAETCQYQ